LALGMLSCIRRAFDLMAAHHKRPLTLATVPREDARVYDMLCKADSVGVFQVESRAQMNMLPRLKPRCFYDLVIEVAIVRPGPIQGDMVHPYLRRRNGIEPEEYPSPAPGHGPPDELKQILGKTKGVPLFQEQAMRIALIAARFSDGEVNELRKAMATFRRRGTIGKLEERMVSRMVERGYESEFAQRCFNQIKGFGEYGFPESHAASFAHLVYVSSWLKCHYPDAFAAAILNSQPMGFYAPAQLVRDACEHGVEVREADVGFSDWDSTLEAVASPSPRWREEGVAAPRPGPLPVAETGRGEARFAVRLGLRQIDGLREEDGKKIVAARSSRREAVGGGIDAQLSSWPSEAIGRTLSRDPGGAGPKDTLLRASHTPLLDPASALACGSLVRDDSLVRLEGDREASAPFLSLEELQERSGVSLATLERLAAADAFCSLGLDRRQALWAVKALAPGRPLPLFAWAETRDTGPDADVALPAMPLSEHVVNDYQTLRLSLKAHPVSFLRGRLQGVRARSCAGLKGLKDGTRVRVGGVVLVRQRPGSANGVVFMTLEDETGIANAVIWPKTLERYRRIVMGARLILINGRIQRHEDIIHVVADSLQDYSGWLTLLSQDEMPDTAVDRADEVVRPDPGSARGSAKGEHPRFSRRHPRNERIIPKSRDFH
ncbi:MAG: error-prone DNA polymerase, partial [Hyphomicrobiaceae bacterium]